MIWESLDTKLIVPDLEASDKNDVFRKVGGMLVEQGFCKPSYVDALIEREKDYPTGINMGAFGIAMPHTERTHVNKAAVAIARLKKPVLFYEMGSEDEEVQASLIFMLCWTKSCARIPKKTSFRSSGTRKVPCDTAGRLRLTPGRHWPANMTSKQ